MRKLVLIVFLLSLLSPSVMAWYNTYTLVVNPSTYPVTGDILDLGPNFGLDIASSPRGRRIRISRIAISNNENTQTQTVYFYDNCNSTGTMTLLWQVELSSASTDPVEFEDFTEKTPLIAEYGLVIRKSSTASAITVSVLYW